MIKLWDNNKIGTLIIGYYRTGTHFLQDVIADQYTDKIEITNEICNDNTIHDLEQLTTSAAPYKLSILNNCAPKFYLTGSNELLTHWHIINLTRNNKVEHFISHWFWYQNSIEDQLIGGVKFKHHGTSNDVYKESLGTVKKEIPLDFVTTWLQEQLINRYIKSDIILDYSDLSKLQSNNIKWTPNRYDDIRLNDIADNYKEIENLLLNFKLDSTM